VAAAAFLRDDMRYRKVTSETRTREDLSSGGKISDNMSAVFENTRVRVSQLTEKNPFHQLRDAVRDVEEACLVNGRGN